MPLNNPVEIAVLSQTATLTDAQIKALPTTGINLIAAPGAGKIILPFYGVVRLNWTADYTNIDSGAQLLLTVGLTELMLVFRQDTQSSVSGILAGGGPDGSLGISTATFIGTVAAAPGGVTKSAISNLYDSDIVNLPLKLSASNGAAGNFTGGHASNTLTVTVLYTIVDV